MAILTKRVFLAGGGGIVLAGALGVGGSLVACNSTRLATLPLERLDVALLDIREPGRIGRAWRTRVGLPAVEAGFLARPGLVAALAPDCAETRRARIRAEVRADFAAGDVVVADRWVVARSECLIAALRAV
jgi:hypothetical protein